MKDQSTTAGATSSAPGSSCAGAGAGAAEQWLGDFADRPSLWPRGSDKFSKYMKNAVVDVRNAGLDPSDKKIVMMELQSEVKELASGLLQRGGEEPSQ